MVYETPQPTDGASQDGAALRQRIAELETALKESQQRLQLIVDNLPQAIFWKDHNSVYEGCNQFFATVAGVGSPANIVGKRDEELAWNLEQAQAFVRDDQEVIAADEPKYHIIEPQLQADGKQAWLDTNKIPLHDSAGGVIGVLGTFEDITPRREVEDALRVSEERFRIVFNTMPVAAIIHQGAEFRMVNATAQVLTGYSQEELRQMHFLDVIHPDFVELVSSRAAARKQGDTVPPRYEIKIIRKGGEERWVELTSNRIDFEGGASVVTTAMDVTERKRMEQALRSSEERFRALVENISAAILIHQVDHFVYANTAAEQITGYTSLELYDVTFPQLIHPDHLPMVQERAMARKRGEDVEPRYEIQIVRKDGSARWVDLSNTIVELDEQIFTISTALDITERKQQEEALRASESRFRVLFDTLSVTTIIVRGTRFLLVNTAAEEMFGYSNAELQQMNFWDIVHPEDQEIVKQRAAAQQRGETAPSRYELRIVRKHGAVRWVELVSQLLEYDGQPSLIVSAFDITERKQAEEERVAFQAQIIEVQRTALRELSTPMMPLADNLIAMPLVGSIDSSRAQQVMEALLQGVADYQADVVILDITGVPVIDTQVADGLLRTARAVRLLGARVIITGISPSMAQTLVRLGADLSGIVTLRTLQRGIAYALEANTR
jgi:PAS domain S-box-containing protein